MHTVCTYFYYGYDTDQFYPYIFFRIASLALGQSYDCPSASQATLKRVIGSYKFFKNKLTILQQQNKAKQIHVHILWDILMV